MDSIKRVHDLHLVAPIIVCPCIQVETEISLLLDRLRGVASVAAFHGSSVKERDPESVLPKGGPNDKAVYDYLVASTAAQVCSAATQLPHTQAHVQVILQYSEYSQQQHEQKAPTDTHHFF